MALAVIQASRERLMAADWSRLSDAGACARAARCLRDAEQALQNPWMGRPVTYSAEMAALARAALRLVASGPQRSGELLAPAQAAKALVARDAVVGEVRALTRAVLDAGAGVRSGPG